jgi:HD-like signal output (HDOD) protein
MKLFGFLIDRAARRTVRPGHDAPVPASEAGAPGRIGPLESESLPAPGLLPRPPGLDDDTLRAVAAVASLNHAHPGERILREGEPLASLYAILEGSVTVTARVDDAATVLTVLPAGGALGTLGGAGTESPYTLTADGPCVWLAISPATLDRLPSPVRLALLRWAAGAAFARLNALLPDHATARRQVAHLADLARARERRITEWVASPAVREVIASIPRLPPYTTDLVTKLLDERAHGEEIVDAITNDPALAALVLKTVNSAYYGLPMKISDCDHALLYLGTAKVYQLVVASGIQSAIPPGPEARDIQVHSKLISLVAYEIARASTLVRPELAATIGLLHDLGRSVVPFIARRHPELALLTDRRDASAVGAALLESWGLPDVIVRPIRHQHAPEFGPPESVPVEYRNAVAIIHLAHLCSDPVLPEEAPPTPAVHASAYLAALGLPARSCEDLWRTTIEPALARQSTQIPAAIRQRLRSDL